MSRAIFHKAKNSELMYWSIISFHVFKCPKMDQNVLEENIEIQNLAYFIKLINVVVNQTKLWANCQLVKKLCSNEIIFSDQVETKLLFSRIC